MTRIVEVSEISFGYSSSNPTLSNLTFSINRGENFGIVGESGSGKSTLLRLLLGLRQPSSGSILINGEKLDIENPQRLLNHRRTVQVVFQDPYSSLDPRQRIDRVIAEPLISLGLVPAGTRKARRDWIQREIIEVLDAVRLSKDSLSKFPHQFSGGQRQRIAIARAIVARPKILLADEPVSSLDVTTRIQIIDLLRKLHGERDLTIITVSHDLSVIASLCKQTAIIQSGRIVEIGRTETVLTKPESEYSKKLISSIPRLHI